MPLFPALTDPSSIPTGDMPGDKVHITDWHLAAAATLYPALREQLDPVLAAGRAVVAVYGGSGVGKSELGSLLGHALNADGIGAYILSGDNYPRRIPSVNDAERLRVFRHAGVRGLVDAGAYDASVRDALSSSRLRGRTPTRRPQPSTLGSRPTSARAPRRSPRTSGHRTRSTSTR